MRSRLLLALFAIPLVCAAVPGAADGQRTHRTHGRVVIHRGDYRYRTAYRDRIYIPAHRYREPVYRSRVVYRDNGYRYRDAYRYRYDDRYYRNDHRIYRRNPNLVDLVLRAAGVRYDDRYRHRHTRRCRHGGRLYIAL
ncbi:MAG TPA: hypothetical protein VF092_31650 [Longimicrobium sp.]